MSGTSADGVDAAIIRTNGEREIHSVGNLTLPYPDDLQCRLVEAARNDIGLTAVMRLEQEITLRHVDAVKQLLNATTTASTDIDLIGFHGHTIRHVPDQSLTWQIGDASLLSEKTGIRVVSDFRRRDMAAGGQGAPLAPLYHAALLPTEIDYPVCVLNLGGVGNLTYLNGSDLIAGDTGPGCGLLDQWCVDQIGTPFDRDGKLASQGSVNESALSKAMQLPFFAKPFPKSADRFEFSQIDVTKLNAEDGAATLCAITAESVARSIKYLPATPKSWYLTGGGGHNPFLVRQLNERLPNVQPITSVGARPDSLEAECFAWLAARHVIDLPTSLPSTTGAQQPTVGGTMTRRKTE